jgi:hypothetical protein
MATGGDTNKKGGKGAPKLKRAARNKSKYARQFARTFKNKLRRVRHSNGEAAASRYAATGPRTPAVPFASTALVKPPKHSVKR